MAGGALAAAPDGVPAVVLPSVLDCQVLLSLDAQATRNPRGARNSQHLHVSGVRNRTDQHESLVRASPPPFRPDVYAGILQPNPSVGRAILPGHPHRTPMAP